VSILHLLNIADYFFMAAGVAVALLMIVMGGNEERRGSDRLDPSESPATRRTRRR
jgi:hypothetical protein